MLHVLLMFRMPVIRFYIDINISQNICTDKLYCEICDSHWCWRLKNSGMFHHPYCQSGKTNKERN